MGVNVCNLDKCKLLAQYGYEYENGERCSKHKELDMVSVYLKRKCRGYGCPKQGTYNLLNEKNGIYCT